MLVERSPTVILRSLRGLLRKRRVALVIATLLTLANFTVYARVWAFDFVAMDDLVYVSDNPHVLNGLSAGNIGWAFTTFHAGLWIPLTWLSLMCDAQVFGAHAGGYHVTNLLFHAGNTLLVFGFLGKATGNQVRAAFVAALFALHPLHVESVAWVTERKDVLSTFFGLLSLVAYVRSAKGARMINLVVSFVFLVCSLASKPTLVTLPLVFLLLDYWPLKRFGTIGARAAAVIALVAEKLPFIAASAAFSVITYFAQRSTEAVGSLAGYPLGTRCLNALVVYVAYLGKLFVPNDLAIFYPHPRGQLAATAVAVAAAVVLAISVAAVIWVRHYPFFIVGWCWYLGTLVPMIGIVQVGRQQMADRFTYFPSIGLFIAFVWLVTELAPAGMLRNRILPAAGALVVCVLAALSFVQVGVWRDSVTLFRHALDCGQDSAVARSFLGSTLVVRGDVSEGMALMESAIVMDREDPEFEFNLAVALQTKGQPDAAARHYERALTIHERDAGIHSNLGVILLNRREYEAAKRNFRRAAEIDPDDVRAYVNLATACLETGDYGESLADSQKALAIDPTSIKGRHNLALALIALGRLDEAIAQFRYLLTALPDDHEARLNLERALDLKRRSAGR
jgi:Tfp pilus assembly protein PilF